jgi:hypothetical protein
VPILEGAHTMVFPVNQTYQNSNTKNTHQSILSSIAAPLWNIEKQIINGLNYKKPLINLFIKHTGTFIRLKRKTLDLT